MDEGLVVVELEMGQGLWGMRVLSVKAGVEQRVVVEKDQAAEGQLAEGLDGQGGGEVVCLRAQPWPLASVKSRVTVRVSADNHSSHPFFFFFSSTAGDLHDLTACNMYILSPTLSLCRLIRTRTSAIFPCSVSHWTPPYSLQSSASHHQNGPLRCSDCRLSSFSMQGAKAQGDAAWNR